jgi:uncharacterized membrane protein
MFTAFQVFLFLHITAAVFAFGPSLVFPILGSMGGSEPMHGNFALRVSEKIEDRVVLPLALTMPVTGVLMIWTGSISLAHFWLIAGIVLYAIAILFAIFVQRQTVIKMVHMTSHAPAPAAAGPGAAPAGPPPEFLALVRRSQMGGMFLTVMILLILILMIFRPGS